ncbi:MAG: hypothetical protein OXF51_00180, partial [Alphaproteobacteria bacterium]|nr:hypothetical protein [Alphaproteobacteria bacterium]
MASAVKTRPAMQRVDQGDDDLVRPLSLAAVTRVQRGFLTQRRCGLVADDAEDMGPVAVVVHRAAHRLAVDRERG